MTGWFTLCLIGLGFSIVEMSLTALVAARIRNAGIVDGVWSLGFGVLALFYALAGAAPVSRRCLMATLAVVWSLRLGIHLMNRIRRHHPLEDVRYAELRREWGAAVRWKMPGFFLLQGVLQVVLSVPFAVVCSHATPSLGWLGWSSLEWSGLALWVVAMTGEAVADYQLQRFRAHPPEPGAVCNTGLWRYSRHPNYFFEWLIWCAFGLLASAAPFGWLCVFAPLLMLYFLLRVTGIPMTEALSLRSKGDAYRAYQRTTSAFVPWFPRTDAPRSRRAA